MKLEITTLLAIGLAASLVGNAVLGWQWAESGAECDTRVETAQRKAVEAERERANKADDESVAISSVVAAVTSEAVKAAIGDTHVREQAIRNVPVTGECRMPVGLPSLSDAIGEANAAAR